jgi:hypothetical protein
MWNSIRVLRLHLTKKMKDKQDSMTSLPLFDQKINRTHAIRLSHVLRGVPLVVMVFICACGVASGQIFFPGGEDHITVDPNAGPEGNGRIYVGDHDLFGGPAPCHYRFDLEPSTHVSSVKIGRFFGLPAISFLDGRGKVTILSLQDFEKVDSQGNPCPEGVRAAGRIPPRSAPKGTGITVSNDADALDISCDARFAVVVGSSDEGKPVSLVDLQSSEEVDTFSDPRNGINVATCDDGESALITLGGDTPIVSVVRRFTISNGGTLTDTGETLTLNNGGSIYRVFAVPGSHVGVAITTEGSPESSRLISFSIPGLNLLDSVTLTGQIGNAAAVSCDGTKVYVRSGNRGPDNDVIEGFALDPVTGTLNHTPILTINNVSFVNLTLTDNPLAVSHDATLLIASEPAIIPNPTVPAPQVTYFDATTGARVGVFEDTDWVNPASISTVPCCAAVPSPTPTPRATTRPRPTPHPRPGAIPRTSPAGIANGTNW